jgi:hypothetical protein
MLSIFEFFADVIQNFILEKSRVSSNIIRNHSLYRNIDENSLHVLMPKLPRALNLKSLNTYNSANSSNN